MTNIERLTKGPEIVEDEVRGDIINKESKMTKLQEFEIVKEMIDKYNMKPTQSMAQNMKNVGISGIGTLKRKSCQRVIFNPMIYSYFGPKDGVKVKLKPGSESKEWFKPLADSEYPWQFEGTTPKVLEGRCKTEINTFIYSFEDTDLDIPDCESKFRFEIYG